MRVPDRKAIVFENVESLVGFRLEPFPIIAIALVEYQ